MDAEPGNASNHQEHAGEHFRRPDVYPNSNLIFGREYVLNDNFDSICGAGFVVYGSWENGCWLRKTPVFTRVFLERFSGTGELGFQTTQWLDSHFLAELVGAAQPPSFQPLFYTSLAGES